LVILFFVIVDFSQTERFQIFNNDESLDQNLAIKLFAKTSTKDLEKFFQSSVFLILIFIWFWWTESGILSLKNFFWMSLLVGKFFSLNIAKFHRKNRKKIFFQKSSIFPPDTNITKKVQNLFSILFGKFPKILFNFEKISFSEFFLKKFLSRALKFSKRFQRWWANLFFLSL